MLAQLQLRCIALAVVNNAYIVYLQLLLRTAPFFYVHISINQ